MDWICRLERITYGKKASINFKIWWQQNAEQCFCIWNEIKGVTFVGQWIKVCWKTVSGKDQLFYCKGKIG